MLYMRRVFVIFLIFLFPLNVLALSMSISSMQPAGPMPAGFASALAGANPDAGADAHRHANFHPNSHLDSSSNSHAGSDIAAEAGPAASLHGPALCDIDPDEPPAGTDFHDCVSREARPQLVLPPQVAVSSPVPSRRGLSPFPPIKPPPRA